MSRGNKRAISRERKRMFARYWSGFVIICATGGIILFAKFALRNSGRTNSDRITFVSLAPLPTPPPPPPQQQTPPRAQEQQKMEQPMIRESEQKPEPAKQPPPLGTGIKGNGPDGYGLSDKPGNGRIGGSGNGAGTKWRAYASEIASNIQQAMQHNPRTRAANLTVNVRVWPDSRSKAARAQLATSTGDPQLDRAIRDEILSGIVLSDPPPADMPLPVTLRIAARRP